MLKKFVHVLIVFTLLTFGIQILTSQNVSAADGGDDCGSRTFLGFLPAWDKYLAHEEVNHRCTPVINGAEAALPIGIAILEAAIRLGGLVAVVMIIVGSFRFITSQGNPENAAAARKTIINSLVGLVIVIISTSVVSFLGTTLSESSGDSSYLNYSKEIS